MTFEDFHPLLASTIKGIAIEYGRKGHWHGATQEDFAQEMIAWLLDNEAKVTTHLAESVEQGTAYVAKCLRNECKDHLSTLKAQSTGDGNETQYDYGREELKVLLQLMFQPADADSTTVQVVESVADVESKFKHLGQDDREILAAFHRDEYSNKMLSELYGISEANMSYRHNRAVLRLQRLLGSTKADEPDFFRGRRALSNTAARAATSASYEESA